ncbi:MAG: hypothetical protein JW973_05990 [Bacteroidales bacterium]|nr:hypothetical protein [Bacteroidales bacterium]
MRKTYFTWLLLIVPLLKISSQSGTMSFNIEAIPGYISSDKTPFWLRSNQYGSIPFDNASMSLLGSARKDYNPAKTGIFDWGASFEGRMNLGESANFTLVEGYGKIRISIIELSAGRTKEVMGLCDTSLSSGCWSISGNALGIPKVQLAIPEFQSLPWFGKVFAFKGQFAHGWMGEKSMILHDSIYRLITYFHQVSLYGRFGKPEWKWKIYAGFNHEAFWGNEQDFYDEDFTLSTFDTYLYIIIGKNYNKGDLRDLRLGNHLGSVDIGFEYGFKKVKFLLYRQNFFEAEALIHLANLQDGLNGLSIENRAFSNNTFRWKKILFEFLYTKNQAGEAWSKYTISPFENYYNHNQYVQGWSYHGVGLGTPFITTSDYVREELPKWPDVYFINNRVRVFHLGFEGAIQKWDYRIKASWSNNYGTYHTTDDEQSTNIENPGSYGVFGRQDQFSMMIDFSRSLRKGFTVGGIAAFDVGELYHDSFGIMLRVTKRFQIGE